MTIGLTDLLRRTRPLLITALPLALCACSPEQQKSANTVAAALLGHEEAAVFSVTSAEPVVEQVAVTTEPSSSSEEVCHVTAWRDVFLDCHGFNAEGPER